MARTVRLFVGRNRSSKRAMQLLREAGIEVQVIDGSKVDRDFNLPLLISDWGVFDNLESIDWYVKVLQRTEGASLRLIRAKEASSH